MSTGGGGGVSGVRRVADGWSVPGSFWTDGVGRIINTGGGEMSCEWCGKGRDIADRSWEQLGRAARLTEAGRGCPACLNRELEKKDEEIKKLKALLERQNSSSIRGWDEVAMKMEEIKSLKGALIRAKSDAASRSLYDTVEKDEEIKKLERQIHNLKARAPCVAWPPDPDLLTVLKAWSRSFTTSGEGGDRYWQIGRDAVFALAALQKKYLPSTKTCDSCGQEVKDA